MRKYNNVTSTNSTLIKNQNKGIIINKETKQKSKDKKRKKNSYKQIRFLNLNYFSFRSHLILFYHFFFLISLKILLPVIEDLIKR